MAILKDLIVHGSSRFLNKIYASELETPLISADAGVFKKLTAKDLTAETATVIGLLDVQGQLHTNTWTNSNIATIDGCFYITPTLSSDTGSIVFSSTSAASLTGTYTAVTSLYVGDATSGSTVQWTAGSNILLTGQVKINNEWIPLGTLLGTLSGNATTSAIGLTGLTDNRHNTSSIITDIRNVVGSTSINYRNLKISLYQRKDGTDSKPLGIYMTAMGTNGRTFIDIYGGVNATTTAGSSGGFADPNLRIGNLSGIPAFTTSAGTTVQPIGWGIYTTNGYFKGAVISDTGSIGGWNLTANSIWSGNSAFGNASGMYFGSSGISLGSTFKVTNAGVLTATAGTIAGWRIESTYLASGSATSPGNNILLLSPSGTSSSYTVAEEAKTGWMITAGSTFGINKDGGIYATSGKIGGFTIGTSSIKNTKTSYSETTYDGVWVGTDGIGLGKGLFYVTNAGALTAKSGSIAGWSFNASSLYKTNATPGYSAATMVISTGTASTKNIGGGGTASKTWMISAGTGFGVTTAGTLYCNDAHISGEITATSGTIGGASITDGTLIIPAANVSGELTAATINGSKITANSITAGQIATSAITADELAANAVTSAKIKAGEVKADNIAADAVTAAKISVDNLSAISASMGTLTSGTISYGTVGSNSSFYLSSSDTSATIAGASRTGLRLTVGSNFGVSNTGALYASNATISGNITATSGTIGGASITDGTLYVTDSNISGTISANHIDASSLSIGISQVTNLQPTLNGKQPSGDYATNTALNNATGWNVIINISAIDYVANTATLHATVYKDGEVKTSGFTLQWYKTVTSIGITPETTTTTIISGETTNTLSVTDLDASYTCVVN